MFYVPSLVVTSAIDFTHSSFLEYGSSKVTNHQSFAVYKLCCYQYLTVFIMWFYERFPSSYIYRRVACTAVQLNNARCAPIYTWYAPRQKKQVFLPGQCPCLPGYKHAYGCIHEYKYPMRLVLHRIGMPYNAILS